MAEEQLVVFQLGKEEYAVPISQVKEIIRYNTATKLPNTPAYVEGIISLRGKIISIINLATRFNVETGSIDDRRAIIVEISGQDIGILVDEVTEVLRLKDSAIEPAPAMTSATSRYIRGIGKDNDRLLILLNLDYLLSAQEIEEITQAL